MMFTALSELQPFETRACRVRTGEIIRNPYMRPYLAIEVEAVHWEKFTRPEGGTLDVIRWTGWELFDGVRTGRRLVRSGGEQRDGRVWVVGDTRYQGGERIMEYIDAERLIRGM